MHNIHFLAHGWRARRDAGFDREGIVAVAAALGVVWGTICEGAAIVVGYDTRFDSREDARLVAGLLASCGLEVRVSTSACPAPVLEWSVARDDSCVGGVYVSGGDYSSDYGGLMACGPDGGSPDKAFVQDVDKLIATCPSEELGPFAWVDLVDDYVGALLGEVDAGAIADLAPRVVVDSMYGTAHFVVPALLRRLGCDVIEIRAQDGSDFGGIHPEPVDPWVDACERSVRQNGADLGISFGATCRRLALVDASGRMVSTHVLPPMVLGHLVEGRGRAGRVVGTLACSARLGRQAQRLGLDCTSVPVGFSRLYDEMSDGDVLLAAEEYGGLAFPWHLAERDAILEALYILELAATSRMSVAQLVERIASQIGRMSYGREDIGLDIAKVQSFRNILPGLNPHAMAGLTPIAVSHADGLKVSFEDDSWALLRPSRTHPLVRAYAEAPTLEGKDNLLTAAEKIVRDGLAGEAAG